MTEGFYDPLFIYDVIQTSCFSVLSGKKVAAAFRRSSVLIESPPSQKTLTGV